MKQTYKDKYEKLKDKYEELEFKYLKQKNKNVSLVRFNRNLIREYQKNLNFLINIYTLFCILLATVTVIIGVLI